MKRAASAHSPFNKECCGFSCVAMDILLENKEGKRIVTGGSSSNISGKKYSKTKNQPNKEKTPAKVLTANTVTIFKLTIYLKNKTKKKKQSRSCPCLLLSKSVLTFPEFLTRLEQLALEANGHVSHISHMAC